MKENHEIGRALVIYAVNKNTTLAELFVLQIEFNACDTFAKWLDTHKLYYENIMAASVGSRFNIVNVINRKDRELLVMRYGIDENGEEEIEHIFIKELDLPKKFVNCVNALCNYVIQDKVIPMLMNHERFRSYLENNNVCYIALEVKESENKLRVRKFETVYDEEEMTFIQKIKDEVWNLQDTLFEFHVENLYFD